MKYILIVCLAIYSSNIVGQEVSFTNEALADVFIAENDTQVSFQDILESYKGKTILIDVWATWCRDCINGMPKVKLLQEENEDVVFLFLSLDNSLEKWKWGIEHYELEGEHYYIPSGWKGPFGLSIKLDWIPRYMVVNQEGEITLYKAVKADDIKIKNALI